MNKQAVSGGIADPDRRNSVDNSSGEFSGKTIAANGIAAPGGTKQKLVPFWLPPDAGVATAGSNGTHSTGDKTTFSEQCHNVVPYSEQDSPDLLKRKRRRRYNSSIPCRPPSASPTPRRQNEDPNPMELAGLRLRRARERLNLRFRDVAEASQQISERHNNPDFAILISRLSDIEVQGTLPSIYRLYSLCCIYRLDLNEVLGWYGIGTESMAADAGLLPLAKTHAIGFAADGDAEVTLPISLNPGIDLKKTLFVSELVQRWGKLPLALVGGIDVRRFRYGFVGTEDWSMHPSIPPGSLLIVDDTKRKIQAGGWHDQTERPIYFLEHRDGFYCRWCSLKDGVLSLIADPSSDVPVLNFAYPDEITVLGQVVGLAISLDRDRQRRARS
jgi:hypothetical protein